MAERRKVWLDVDTGVDDALAIILALRSPELEVVGISTVAGNTTVENATRNTLLVLDLLQAPEIPVARGAAEPLLRPRFMAPEVHGADGLGNATAVYPPPKRRAASAPASELLLETLGRFPGEITVIATGPQTNLTLALERDRASFVQVKELVIMGGAIRVPGNTTAVAEFNFYADPDAAARIVNSGVPMHLLPLDVTQQVHVERNDFRRLAHERDSSVFQFIREFTVFYFTLHAKLLGFDGGYLHDPMAVAAAIDPSLIAWEEMRVEVETKGEFTSGMSVADVRSFAPRCAPNAQVARKVDGARFLEMFFDRVCR